MLVGSGHDRPCAGRERSVPVPTGAVADRNHGEIARNAIFEFFKNKNKKIIFIFFQKISRNCDGLSKFTVLLFKIESIYIYTYNKK